MPSITPRPTSTGKVPRRYVTKITPTKRGQRVWFRCDDCGAYGDTSGTIEATEAAVGFFATIHLTRCAPLAVGEASE